MKQERDRKEDVYDRDRDRDRCALYFPLTEPYSFALRKQGITLQGYYLSCVPLTF